MARLIRLRHSGSDNREGKNVPIAAINLNINQTPSIICLFSKLLTIQRLTTFGIMDADWRKLRRVRLATQRQRDEKDRRIVWIIPTEKGYSEHARGLHVRDSFIEAQLDRISSHNQQLLMFLLGKVAN